MYFDAWCVVFKHVNIVENMQLQCVSSELYTFVHEYIKHLQQSLQSIKVKAATKHTIELRMRYKKCSGWGLHCKHVEPRFIPLYVLRDDMSWIDTQSAIRVCTPNTIEVSVWFRYCDELRVYRYRVNTPLEWPRLAACKNDVRYV